MSIAQVKHLAKHTRQLAREHCVGQALIEVDISRSSEMKLCCLVRLAGIALFSQLHMVDHLNTILSIPTQPIEPQLDGWQLVLQIAVVVEQQPPDRPFQQREVARKFNGMLQAGL